MSSKEDSEQVDDKDELELMNAEVIEDEDDGDYNPSSSSSSSSSSAAHSRSAGRKGPHPELPKDILELRKRRTAKLQELTRQANDERRIHGDAQVTKRIEFFTKGAELFTQYTLEQARLDAAHEAHEKEGGGAGGKKGKKAAGGAGARASHRLTEQEEDEELVAEAEETGRVARLTKQPTLINGTMREYQLEGLNWMISLHDRGISGILADEMGLGKTLQSISLLTYVHEFRNVRGPHLVLVPKSVLGNWHREFTKFAPSIKAFKMQAADKEERQRMIREELVPGKWEVIITSFETFCIEHAAFKRLQFYYIVIDEAHRIKNEKSVLAQRVRQMDSEFRLLLTGTPLQNNLHELWALLNFLIPDLFGSSEDFDAFLNMASAKSRQMAAARGKPLPQASPSSSSAAPAASPSSAAEPSASPDAAGGAGGAGGAASSSSSSSSGDSEGGADAAQQVVKKLHAILRPFLLRRLKADVEKSLLPKKESKLFVKMTDMQRLWYKNLLLKDSSALNAIGGSDRVRLLNILMQLRKVCNHPYLFDGAEPGPPYFDGPHLWENSGKMMLLHKLLPKLKAQGSRVLIFSQMTRQLDIFEDYCRMTGVTYCRIDGDTPGADRDRQMDEYNAPNSDKFLFMLSTRAGGLGINLYTADVVILYDSDWNPQMDLQAMDRAHRIGQKKQVRVFRFVTENSVEEKIVERAYKKLALDALVIQQGRLQAQDKALSKGEIMSMVKFGADEIIRATGSTAALTDEDVDVILAQGEERTQKENEKLKVEMAETLRALSLDNLDFSGKASTFGGSVDEAAKRVLYSKEELAEIEAIDEGKGVGGFLDIGPRDRKQKASYNEAIAFHAAMSGHQVVSSMMPEGTTNVRNAGRKIGYTFRTKPPVMLEFQFYNKARIEELFDKENQWAIPRRDLTIRIKEAKTQEERTKKKFIREQLKSLLGRAYRRSAQEDDDDEPASASSSSSSSSADLVSPAEGTGTGMSEAEAFAEAERRWAESEGSSGNLESARLEAELAALQLSEEEQAEKDRLVAQGFKDWSKRDYKVFTTACEKHGRSAKEAVVHEVAEATDKSVEEVARYYDVFVTRCTELSDWEKLSDRISKGEQKIKRRQVLERVLSEKVSRCLDPFNNLSIPYQFAPKTAAAQSTRGFNEEEDRFLVCMLNNLGYGNWEQLRTEIRKTECFRFNWFMKSRTTEELHRRCDALIRLLEKEAGESNLVPTWSGMWGSKDNAAAAAAGAGGAGAGALAGVKRKKLAAASKGGDDAASVAGSEDAAAAAGPKAKKART